MVELGQRNKTANGLVYMDRHPADAAGARRSDQPVGQSLRSYPTPFLLFGC